jgi:hypothetical protein
MLRLTELSDNALTRPFEGHAICTSEVAADVPPPGDKEVSSSAPSWLSASVGDARARPSPKVIKV